MKKEIDSIPHTLHYCWFGGLPLPERASEAIATWARHMPDWQILRWDEDNFEGADCSFFTQAYNAKRWAFASDYARFHILQTHGGIYMDVGSYLVRSLAPLAMQGAFSARERNTKYASPGLVLASEPNNPIISQTANIYRHLDFFDSYDFMSSHTVNQIFVSVLRPYGYKTQDVQWSAGNFTIYPSRYFSPLLSFGGYRISKDTYSYHLGSASWTAPNERFRINFINKYAPYMGDFSARKAARIIMYMRFGQWR